MSSARRAWQLYPKNRSSRLDLRLFRKPTAEYRGTPFWSWNNKLHLPQLLRQIGQLRQMGFGGVHIHARTGLATEYLGQEFVSCVRKCAARLKKLGMLAWLYDEDRWPSGFAGGIVTRDQRWRERTIRFTRSADASGTLLARYSVALSGGRIEAFERLAQDQPASGDTWHVFLQTAQPETWFNNQTYVDTFQPAAIERFIEVTHERYRKAVGGEFGKSIPAIFTDEPHFTKKQNQAVAEDPREVVLPFTDDFCDSFIRAYGYDLRSHLPELVWDRADGQPSLARYHYHDHTAERFARAFGDTIGAWCGRQGIALTGHMLSEATLYGQTRAVGEVMRGLRSFQLPGIDMLEDKIELTTAKQAQSVARQHGRPGVLSEMYGVTNWDFDFAGHKRQGDWQAALGITVRVPHLAWVSMAGEAKRDYPAAIGYQSPWYREYNLIEDHFARVATVMTRGRPIVRVAVIHPIESFWLHWGPADQNAAEWKRREQQFKDLTSCLVYGGIDFDFVSEASLAGKDADGALRMKDAPHDQRSGPFTLGRMRYEAVVLPNLQTIRSTTLSQLQRTGSLLLIAGEIPGLIDARPAAVRLPTAQHIPLTGDALLAALEPFRDIEITTGPGRRTDTVAHQLRADGDHRHLLLCNTDKRRPVGNINIRLKGHWQPTRLDTITGRTGTIGAIVDDTHTSIPWRLEAHDHLLLTLEPGRPKAPRPTPRRRATEKLIRGPVPISLSEPNVLLLDQAEWRLNDDTQWQPREEILRLDNLARERLGLAARGGRTAQPWTDTTPDPVVGTLHLRFTFRSDVAVKNPELAIEDAATIAITFDGKPVRSKPVGWWVDEAIQTVRLPGFGKGRHELIASIPMRRRTNVEWCYLLGDFGVRVRGREAKVIAAPAALRFGDWTHQGLPFYAGNVTYHCPVRGGGRTTLRAGDFTNPLLSVRLGRKSLGPIAFAPHEIDLGTLTGKHQLDITAFGNRHNAFGPLHHTKRDLTWVGPAAWRSTGEWWSYDYHFKPIGILKSPKLITRRDAAGGRASPQRR